MPTREKERDGNEAASAEKAKRLAPVVEAALARKAEVEQLVDIGEYEFPAIPRQWADATGSEELRNQLDQWADNTAAGKTDTGVGLIQ